MTKMAFHLYACALVLQGLLGWSVMPMVGLMGAVVALITVIGGFTAVAYTDSIQTAIMIGGCGLMLMIGLHRVGDGIPWLLRCQARCTQQNRLQCGILALLTIALYAWLW
jgi:Na+/proline symporter